VLDHIRTLEAPVLIMPAVSGDILAEEGPVETALRTFGKSFETHGYPNSRTGFDNPNVPGAYNAEYARDAWERTFTFLKKHLEV
jgi:dienelactone hydrolase